jgi:hypothetical protein
VCGNVIVALATELDRAEQGTESWYLKALQHPPAGGTKLLDLHWVAFALSTNQARAFVFATSRTGTTDKPKDILSERRDEGGSERRGQIRFSRRREEGRRDGLALYPLFIDCGMGFSDAVGNTGSSTYLFYFFFGSFFSKKAHFVV